mmetsp:Transcript_6273/g.19057  ORF Transcript_6273/g.19057 Transcript_6273/m.19057 type:complete len:213 (-) Transcript_6273:95-733(-)
MLRRLQGSSEWVDGVRDTPVDAETDGVVKVQGEEVAFAEGDLKRLCAESGVTNLGEVLGVSREAPRFERRRDRVLFSAEAGVGLGQAFSMFCTTSAAMLSSSSQESCSADRGAIVLGSWCSASGSSVFSRFSCLMECVFLARRRDGFPCSSASSSSCSSSSSSLSLYCSSSISMSSTSSTTAQDSSPSSMTTSSFTSRSSASSSVGGSLWTW